MTDRRDPVELTAASCMFRAMPVLIAVAAVLVIACSVWGAWCR